MNTHSFHSMPVAPVAPAFVKPQLSGQPVFKPLGSLRTPRWRQPRFSAGSLALTISAGILLALII